MKSTDLSTRRWELAKHYFRRYVEDEMRLDPRPLAKVVRRALWRAAYEEAKAQLERRATVELEVPAVIEGPPAAPDQP
jgi:hypothetical protein